MKELLLLVPFLMGWVVGLIQGSAKEKQLAQELKLEKEKVQQLRSEKVRPLALLKESGWELAQARQSENLQKQ